MICHDTHLSPAIKRQAWRNEDVVRTPVDKQPLDGIRLGQHVSIHNEDVLVLRSKEPLHLHVAIMRNSVRKLHDVNLIPLVSKPLCRLRDLGEVVVVVRLVAVEVAVGVEVADTQEDSPALMLTTTQPRSKMNAGVKLSRIGWLQIRSNGLRT